ncbi:MAG: hypothetical protein M3Q05_09620 [Bacteroidota bacterium]|nr:hypothetical protein [Bacteroidota bacterium]
MKILVLVFLTIILGANALTLISRNEASLITPSHLQATRRISFLSHHINEVHKEYGSPKFEKHSFDQAYFFKDDKSSGSHLKKKYRDELKKAFTFIAKFELSSQILSFSKTYKIRLTKTEHHSPLYVIDSEFLI